MMTFKRYEKASYEGDVQRNEYGEWMLDEQYKLSLLAFMGLLYGTDIAESWIPLTRGHCWGALTPPPCRGVGSTAISVPPEVALYYAIYADVRNFVNS